MLAADWRWRLDEQRHQFHCLGILAGVVVAKKEGAGLLGEIHSSFDVRLAGGRHPSDFGSRNLVGFFDRRGAEGVALMHPFERLVKAKRCVLHLVWARFDYFRVRFIDHFFLS